MTCSPSDHAAAGKKNEQRSRPITTLGARDTMEFSFREAGLAGAREKYGAAVLAVRRGRDLVLTPDPEDTIQAGDVLVIACRDEILAQLIAEPDSDKS